jgi:hypothetical protein
MEKFIFLVIVFILITVVESLSTKKGAGTKPEDDWDVSEFDFSNIKSAPKNDDLKIFDEIKRAGPRDETERSAENELYFENKSVYIEQPLSQDSAYIQQPSAQADSYINQNGSYETVAGDAYKVNTGGGIVKSKKDSEKSKKNLAVGGDSHYALSALEEAAASGDVIDRKAESLSNERRESKTARKALKKMNSSDKSSMGGMAAFDAHDEAGVESFDVASMFTGPNIKKTILASIILDKTKF